MKKILLSILLLGIFVFSFAGCTNKNDSRLGEVSDIEINENYVSTSIKEGTLTNKGAVFILNNISDKLLQYGEPYHLEIKDNNTWYILKPIKELSFIAPLYYLEANKSVELDIDWSYGYGNLEPGEYRFIKSFAYPSGDNDIESFNIGIEFTIN